MDLHGARLLGCQLQLQHPALAGTERTDRVGLAVGARGRQIDGHVLGRAVARVAQTCTLNTLDSPYFISKRALDVHRQLRLLDLDSGGE